MESQFVFPNSSFKLSNYFTQLTPATALIISFVFFSACRIIKRYSPATLNKMFCMTTSKEVTKVFDADVELLPFSSAM